MSADAFAQHAWHQAESKRYRKIADEKMKEFDAVVRQNVSWLNEYVESILGGTQAEYAASNTVPHAHADIVEIKTMTK